MNSELWKNKSVLLTGHTGFKGSWLSLWLQKLGTNLTGFSNTILTNPSLFEVAKVENGMTSIMGDIRNYEQIRQVLRDSKPEIIFHMAAQSLVRRSYKNPLETFQTNIMGTANLFEAIRDIGISCVVINVTSDKCYENKGLSQGYKEDDPMGGYDPYSSSKGCAELVTSSLRNSFFNPNDFNNHHVAISSVRAGNVIGGGDWAEDRLIPDMIRGFLENTPFKIRNPDAIRPWQHVLEPLNGYILLAEKLIDDKLEFSGAWNFGPHDNDVKPVSWIVNYFKNYLAIHEEEKLNEHMLYEEKYLKLDCTKAKTKLNWNPKMNLQLALDWTIEWYKNYHSKNNMREYTEKQINDFISLP